VSYEIQAIDIDFHLSMYEAALHGGVFETVLLVSKFYLFIYHFLRRSFLVIARIYW
jgi:hypothetical protein